MKSKEAVEVLYRIQKEKQIAYDYFIRRIMPKDCIKAQNRITKEHKEAINALSEALLALEGNDCVAFGFWLVNAPNKELYSEKWVEQKHQQYLREKKEVLQ